jgi:hypothetical protein
MYGLVVDIGEQYMGKDKKENGNRNMKKDE